MIEKSEKNQKKLNDYVKADLNKQEELFQHRMLKRVKSAGRLLWFSFAIYLCNFYDFRLLS